MSESNPQKNPGADLLLEACIKCGAELDVTVLEPLADVTCPRCGEVNQARTQLQNYVIESVLGVGGMGTVYKARDVNLNRQVALKVILKEFSSDPELLKKFEEEARTTALVNHPNVVKIYSFGSDHGVFFIAMEIADHGSLDDLMTIKGRIPEVETIEAGIQIAEGLRAAQLRGLIHRDVKPGNILFTEDNTAKIVDFGLACLAGDQAEERGEIWGTPYYVAPEKLVQKPEDFRSDMYSLGATLYHAMAGRPPHDAETVSVVELQKIKAKPVNLKAVAPDISNATALVIHRMLLHDPDLRYHSYGELIEDLIRAHNRLTDGGADSPHSGLVPVVMGNANRRTWMILLAVIVFVIVVGACAGLLLKPHGNRNPSVTPSQEPVAADLAKEKAAALASLNIKYEDARKLILTGDYKGARTILDDLATKPNLPQPLGRWIMIQQGLDGLISGDMPYARDAFKKLQDHGFYSLDPEAKVLANFFVETGQIIASGRAVPVSETMTANPADFGALTLIISALNDWQMSRFDDAGALFRAYLHSEPQPPYAWISDYKPVARIFMAKYDAYKKVSSEIAAAKDLNGKKTALEHLKALTSGHQARGKLTIKLEEIQKTLETEIATLQAAENKKQSDELAAKREQDDKLLAGVKVKYNAFVEGMQFDEAVAAVEGVQALSDPESESGRIFLLKKAQWLVRFKSQLIKDITESGYPQPVSKRNGAAISGLAHSATKIHIDFKTPYGIVGVQWLELAPATILGMADYFTKKNAEPDSEADRLWISGVYATEFGLQSQALPLLKSAADKKAEYRDQIELLTRGQR